jgi:hypothetical protein
MLAELLRQRGAAVEMPALRILINKFAGIVGIDLDAAQPIGVGQVAPGRHHPVVRGFRRVGRWSAPGNQIVADALARANGGRMGEHRFVTL